MVDQESQRLGQETDGSFSKDHLPAMDRTAEFLTHQFDSGLTHLDGWSDWAVGSIRLLARAFDEQSLG